MSVPGDGIERGLHGAAHESQRTPHECGARCGHEDARHAAASHRIPPQYEHRSPVPPGWFIFSSVQAAKPGIRGYYGDGNVICTFKEKVKM